MAISRVVISCLISVALLSQAILALAQEQQAGPICDEQRALILIYQQVDATKALDDAVKRIAILNRAADLLWTIQEDTARDYFTRAMEAAEKNFQESGENRRKDGRLTVVGGDQRFVVMRAIARRDPAWAKKLAERIAEKTKPPAKKPKANKPSN